MRTAVLVRNRCPFIGIAVNLAGLSARGGPPDVAKQGPVGVCVIEILMRDLLGHDLSMLQRDYLL